VSVVLPLVSRILVGIDLSPVQIAFAEETLQPFAQPARLIESPMELNPGVPQNHFDLVFCMYELGWTTGLRATLNHVSPVSSSAGSNAASEVR